MKQIVFSLVLMCCLLLVAPLHAASPPAPLTDIPITILNNRILVSAEIQGNQVTLALDTGATKSALFESHTFTISTAHKTGLPSEILFPALDESVSGLKLAGFAIQLGTYGYEPESLLFVDRNHSVGDRLNIQFNGVLGQDFFSKHVIEIDPLENRLRIYTKYTNLRSFYPTVLTLYMQDSSPHIKLMSRMPWEDLSGTKDMLLDTGYPGFMVFWSERHFNKASQGSNRDRLIDENKGIFTRTSFRVGTLRFVRAPVFVSPNEPKQLHERDGLIGANVLAQFKHVIDFPSRRLLLKAKVINFNNIDGALYLPNDEGYIVKNFLTETAGPSTIFTNGDY